MIVACVAGLIATSLVSAQPKATLTIEVDGDMLLYGGVLTVYPIPTPAAAPSAGTEDTKPVRVTARYAQVQLRYPTGGTYAFEIHPVGKESDFAQFKTQILTVIGTDDSGRSAPMQAGFVGAYASGGQVIRVLPRAEWGGSDEATRAAARWGKTQVYADLPPADSRSARSLVSVVEDPMRPVPLQCDGDARAMACTVSADRWPSVETRWWRLIAEQRLERLDFYALSRCWDAQWFRSKTCSADPDADEPSYR